MEFRHNEGVSERRPNAAMSYSNMDIRGSTKPGRACNTSEINFLDFLVKEIPLDYKLKKYKMRKSPIDPVGFEIDDSHRFRNTVSIAKSGNSTIQSLSSSSRNSTMRDYIKKKQLEMDMKSQYERHFGSEKTEAAVPLEIVGWEHETICSDENDVSVSEYVNGLIEEDWNREIYIEPKEMPNFKDFITLYIDDPNLIFEKVEEKKSKLRKKAAKPSICDKPLKNKYNISNDRYYVTDTKRKASLGTFGVQHSLPALRLDPKFYKTNHSKEELRNFHRPQNCLQGSEYRFKPVSKTKFTGNIIKKGHDLTLGDSTSFFVFEYSEEYPFFVVNPGMVSLLNTYYRKSDAADEAVPENCIVLEPGEEAPFFGFGDVKPGVHLSTLANNLFISPIFEHKTQDFLCIIEGDEIMMRPIDRIYLVGQEFPKEEVFAPHSRKLNQFCKDRLKVAAYRIFAKGRDLLMQQLDQMFPYFSEGSKRKWLKEYSDCVKKGKDNVWVLKDSFSIIGEEDLRKLVTPENICQYESMLSAERRMQDLGYKCLEGEDEEQDYEAYSPSWYLSRNFINAANGRGLLELSSPADSLGTGESFSFRKIKLKKGNESENRKIISEHQASYKERIESIWTRQMESLSMPEPVSYKPVVQKSSFEFPSETTANDANCLAIKRMYEENGVVVWKTEKIYDPKIIRAYLKARKRTRPDEKKALLTCSSCGQPGHMKTNKSCPNFAGISKPSRRKPEEKKRPLVLFQEKLQRLVSGYMSIPFSNAFHRPVSLKKFPSYGSIVKNPIDLGTIKSKAKSGSYKQFLTFLEDLRLMRDNCVLYNGPSHSLTEIAENIYNQGRSYYEANRNEIMELEGLIRTEEADNPQTFL